MYIHTPLDRIIHKISRMNLVAFPALYLRTDLNCFRMLGLDMTANISVSPALRTFKRNAVLAAVGASLLQPILYTPVTTLFIVCDIEVLLWESPSLTFTAKLRSRAPRAHSLLLLWSLAVSFGISESQRAVG